MVYHINHIVTIIVLYFILFTTSLVYILTSNTSSILTGILTSIYYLVLYIYYKVQGIHLSPQEAARVKVTLYYEHLCPYSVDFIKKQLEPTYRKIGNIMEIELHAYGNIIEKVNFLYFSVSRTRKSSKKKSIFRG